VTSGAASDIQQCTRVARAMVTQLGFSDKLGTVAYADPQQEQFLGYSLGRQQTISEATQQMIDGEVRRLVQESYDKAKEILTDKRQELETLANGLLEFETLSGEEIVGLLAGKRPVREETPPPPRPTAVPSTGQPRPEPDVGGMEPHPV
jgi:cell division protease FtsH